LSGPAFDELLRRLAAAEIRFVLVGGLAVNAWGVIRGTKDLDVVADPEPENLTRLAATAVSVHGRVHMPTAFLSSQSSIAALLAEGERVEIRTALGPLDVVQGLPGVPSYADLRARVTEVEINGVAVAVPQVTQAHRTDAASIYNLDMATEPRAKPQGPWTTEEIARNERANQAQVAHDRARGVSANLEEAVALSRFANRFSEAFRHIRRP